MAGKENLAPRHTRAAAKRVASASSAANNPPAKKKRVALSELPTLSNAIVRNPSPDPLAAPSKPKQRSRKGEQEKVVVVAVDEKRPPLELSNGAESEIDDLQMCSPYVCDIYQYLRSMEVGV